MGDPTLPRSSISSPRRVVAQGRSSKARPPRLEPIGRELGKLWKQLETLPGEDARRPIRERIRSLEAQYYAARAALPQKEQPAGFSYRRRWKGRVYQVDPMGISAARAQATISWIMPGGLACSDREVRDRFLVALWHFRKTAIITVGVAATMGKPKVRCAGCGTVRLAWDPWKPEIPSVCKCCDSKFYAPIDPAAVRPCSERRLPVTQNDLCRRFHVTRAHLRAVIKRYSPPKDKPPRPDSAVSTEVSPSQ